MSLTSDVEAKRGRNVASGSEIKINCHRSHSPASIFD
jgi:hypothetical protein